MKSSPTPSTSAPQHFRDPALDLIRGLAAFMVVLHHARNLLFVDYQKSISLPFKVFYFISNFGPAAVIIFFVLSGYLVGGSVIDRMLQNKWSWKTYLSLRLTRLWVVLIPAVFLTYAIDQSAVHYFMSSFYDGTEGNMILRDPVTNALTVPIAICNVAFLQTLTCPTLGSNGALWSLANEFWYYLWFPAIAALAFGNYRNSRGWLIAIIGISSIAIFPQLLPGFALWLLGVAAYFVKKNTPAKLENIFRHAEWPLFIVFLLSLVASRFKFGGDNTIGISFFLYFSCLIKSSFRNFPTWIEAISAWLSDQSFTLYLAHTPFLTFLISTIVGKRLAPSMLSFSLFMGLMVLTYAYSSILYELFEKRTSSIRKFIFKS